MVKKHIHRYTKKPDATLSGCINQALTYLNLALNHFKHPLVQYI